MTPCPKVQLNRMPWLRRSTCANLLQAWDTAYAGVGTVTLGLEHEESDPVRLGVAPAFAGHTHHATATACRLMSDGDYTSALPLLRLAPALSATWARTPQKLDAGCATSTSDCQIPSARRRSNRFGAE